MTPFLKKASSITLTILLSTLVVAGIVYAGNLTAPGGSPSSQSYTLGDIYTRLTTNATTTSGNHSLSTTTSPASSFYSLTDIYNSIPTIDPTKVLTGTSYLGVAGSASAGSPYPAVPLKSNVISCGAGNASTFSTVSCTGTGQDGETQNGTARSYTDNGDGTITDNSTGLMWQKCSDGQSGSDCSGGSFIELAFDDGNGYLGGVHQPAINYCATLSLGGHSDWRLPDVNELVSIVDFGQDNPSINTTYFPNTAPYFYLSSTEFVDGGLNGIYAVTFSIAPSSSGTVAPESPFTSYIVRCVRSLP